MLTPVVLRGLIGMPPTGWAMLAGSLRAKLSPRLSSRHFRKAEVATYFGARRSPRSQPLTVSDCIGSARSATVLRNSNRLEPLGGSGPSARVPCGSVTCWDEVITLTWSTGGSTMLSVAVGCLGGRRWNKRAQKFRHGLFYIAHLADILGACERIISGEGFPGRRGPFRCTRRPNRL